MSNYFELICTDRTPIERAIADKLECTEVLGCGFEIKLTRNMQNRKFRLTITELEIGQEPEQSNA